MSYYGSQVIIFVYQNWRAWFEVKSFPEPQKWIAAQHRETLLSVSEAANCRKQHTRNDRTFDHSIFSNTQKEALQTTFATKKYERRDEEISCSEQKQHDSTSTIPPLHVLHSQARTQRPVKVFNGIPLATNFTLKHL